MNTKTIELILLPPLELLGSEPREDDILKRPKRMHDRISERIKGLMEPEKYYVVSVDSSYVSGRKGHVRRKTTHYLAKLVGTDNHFVQLSGYPTYVFGEP